MATSIKDDRASWLANKMTWIYPDFKIFRLALLTKRLRIGVVAAQRQVKFGLKKPKVS